MTSRPKGWPASRLWPSGCQPHNLRKTVHGCPTLPGVAEMQGLPSPRNFKGTQDYQVVQHEVMVALAMALQRCTIHSGTSSGMLCRAVQELHGCLASVIENGDLVDLKMLDMVERDPMVIWPYSWNA